MAKKVTGFVKLQIPAGQATPAPPVGTALGPQGVNIMAFVKEFNSRTAKEAGVEKGSGQPNRNKVGKVTRAQVRKIAELKLVDLNCDTVESAMAMVAGAARSMGIEVVD